jgi:molybdenum cofactor guanylyltransferase
MVACIVLAGGGSTRMKGAKQGDSSGDGVNKAFLILGERPIVSYVLETARKFFDQITIVVKSSRQKAEMDGIVRKLGLSGTRVIADNSRVYSPIAGIKAGLEVASGDYVFVVGCDMPFVNGVTIFRLMNRVRKDIDCVVPSSGGRHEPLCAIYSRNVFDNAELTDSLQEIIERSKKILVPVFDKQIFFNVNTKDDLVHAEKILKGIKEASE